MNIVLLMAIAFVISCAVLIAAPLIGQRLVGFDLPPFGELLYKAVMVCLIVSVIGGPCRACT